MTPHVSDTVLVFADPHYNNGADVAPAVITRVSSPAMINVRVLYDGPAVPPQHRIDWMTSVPLYSSQAAAEAAHASRWAKAGHEVAKSGAFWPPCEPESYPEPLHLDVKASLQVGPDGSEHTEVVAAASL